MTIQLQSQTNMGRKNDLTEEEKSVILSPADEKRSVCYIASRVKRSESAVHQVILNSRFEYVGTRLGAKPKISKIQHRAIVKAASNVTRTAREIRDTFNCKVTVRGIQQVLRSAPNLEHQKMISSPSLTIKHEEERVKWAKSYSHWSTRCLSSQMKRSSI